MMKIVFVRNEYMVNLNTVEKTELSSSCLLTPKVIPKMPFALYDHMSFYINGR
jgi:hypothetical protein